MKLSEKLVMMTLLSHLPLAAIAAPSITNVDITQLGSKKITINGSNFGNGPTVNVFDDFEGGNAGDKIPYTNAKVGQWKQYKTNPQPVFDSVAHSGKSSANMVGLRKDLTLYWSGSKWSADFKAAATTTVVDGIYTQQFMTEMPAETTEVFISYWVHVPKTSPWPYKGSSDPNVPQPAYLETFPGTSSWKLTWLFDIDEINGQDTGGVNSNICLPTWANKFYFNGNDFQQTSGSDVARLSIPDPHWADAFTGWWNWDKFIRISVWMKADKAQVADLKNNIITRAKGTFKYQIVTQKGTGQSVFNQEIPDFEIFDNDGYPHFTNLTFPGWIAEESLPSTKLLYDDVYVAAGDNAAARVEIGDNPDYSKANLLAIQVPSAWNNNQITIDLKKGAFDTLDGKYLFVFDANGVRNTTGYKLGIKPTPPPVTGVK